MKTRALRWERSGSGRHEKHWRRKAPHGTPGRQGGRETGRHLAPPRAACRTRLASSLARGPAGRPAKSLHVRMEGKRQQPAGRGTDAVAGQQSDAKHRRRELHAGTQLRPLTSGQHCHAARCVPCTGCEAAPAGLPPRGGRTCHSKHCVAAPEGLGQGSRVLKIGFHHLERERGRAGFRNGNPGSSEWSHGGWPRVHGGSGRHPSQTRQTLWAAPPPCLASSPPRPPPPGLPQRGWTGCG